MFSKIQNEHIFMEENSKTTLFHLQILLKIYEK